MSFRFHAKCDRRSTSLVQAHCPTCCATFSGYRAFDEHRTVIPKSRGGDGVDRECNPPGSLTRKDGTPVLFPDGTAHGTVWRFWRAEPNPMANGHAPSRRTECSPAA